MGGRPFYPYLQLDLHIPQAYLGCKSHTRAQTLRNR